MQAQAPPEKTQIDIPYGIVEYTAIFEAPVAAGLSSRTDVIGSVLSALKPWGFSLDGVEINATSTKLNEHALVFRRTIPASPAMSLALGYGRVLVSAENLDWAEADQFLKAMTAGLGALAETIKPTIRSQHVALGMHIQCKTKPRQEVTAPLLSPVALQLLDGDVKFQGIILNRHMSSIIVDASAAYANGLFIRIFREHPAEATLEQLAGALRADEEQLFQVLGLDGTL